MEHLEGILVSRNEHINTSAAGADIEGSNLFFRIYSPSNTFSNLTKTDRFTFSLTDDRELFYRGALIGHDNEVQELRNEELKKDDGHPYPEGASKVFFCSIIFRQIKTVKDEYGCSDVLFVKTKVTKSIGEGEYIQREDPHVNALVHASRYHIASPEQKKQIRSRVRKILKNEEDNLSQKILDHVGAANK
ncbi:MAG: DUF447 family protein [Thermoplasmata archaeon]